MRGRHRGRRRDGEALGEARLGLGRELGPEGLAEYLESKTIVLPQGFEPN